MQPGQDIAKSWPPRRASTRMALSPAALRRRQRRRGRLAPILCLDASPARRVSSRADRNEHRRRRPRAEGDATLSLQAALPQTREHEHDYEGESASPPPPWIDERRHERGCALLSARRAALRRWHERLLGLGPGPRFGALLPPCHGAASVLVAVIQRMTRVGSCDGLWTVPTILPMKVTGSPPPP